ncbi:MAG: SAM-dependent methyltransferase, partial [Mycobacterium sp.]
PEGHIGKLWATMKAYAAAPPAGAQPPPLWGNEDHVTALLGDRVTDVVMERRMLTVDHFVDGAAFRDYFKATYGPTIAVYRNIEGDAARVEELDAAIAYVGDSVLSGSSTMEWEYLLLTARKT